MDEVVVLNGADGYAEFRVPEIVFGPLERATWFLDEKTAQRYLGHAVKMGAISGVEAATLVTCVVPRTAVTRRKERPDPVTARELARQHIELTPEQARVIIDAVDNPQPVPRLREAVERARERVLASEANRRVVRALADAPLDDEPFTEEEQRAVQKAREAVERGEVISHDELCRRLGLERKP